MLKLESLYFMMIFIDLTVDFISLSVSATIYHSCVSIDVKVFGVGFFWGSTLAVDFKFKTK